MRRKKEIIYVSHCVLNQNSVIRDWERAEGAFNKLVKAILDQNISIVQLPCPEFKFLGESRPPLTKEEYDTKEYRSLCNSLSLSFIEDMKDYLKNDYKIIGLIGIGDSPSCDTLSKRGVFMEELFSNLNKYNIDLKTFDIPVDYIEGSSKEFVENISDFLKNGN